METIVVRRITTPSGQVLEVIQPGVPVNSEPHEAAGFFRGEPEYRLDGKAITRDEAQAFVDRYMKKMTRKLRSVSELRDRRQVVWNQAKELRERAFSECREFTRDETDCWVLLLAELRDLDEGILAFS